MIKNPSTEYFTGYHNLIRQVDALAEAVITASSHHITCHPGCSHCCQSQLTVNTVESLHMTRALAGKKIDPHNDTEKCIFLKEEKCIIYQARPLVCRTQGLPLLYGLSDEENPPELSVCELNFTGLEEISQESCLDMDRINLALSAVNLKFIRDTGRKDACIEERFSFEKIAGGVLTLKNTPGR